MALKLVSAATSDKLAETDWSKNIEICELVARDHRQAKDIVKAIKKRLGSKNQNTQLFAVLLLEMLMNNIGEPVHKQVIDIGALPILVKIVMKTSDLPVRERIFLLLDAAQTSLGGASGRFPQYYNAYYELVCAGVQFPRRLRDIPKPHSTSNANKNSSPDKESAAPQFERHLPRKQEKKVSELSSVLQKAGASLEVLRDVLNTIDSQHPEVAKEEFTLDLVEQCSFAKQRVMQLAVTSLDEVIITRAVELNEQLEIVIRRHDALLDRRPLFMSNQINHGQEVEEEEAEQLFRRIRKGKACMLPEDEEEHHVNALLGLMGHSIPDHMLQRPLIRENMEPQREHIEPKQENIQPLNMVLKHEPNLGKAAVAIPPPPAKHVEREKFFQENKLANGSPALNGLMRNLSLQSRNASSSHSGSTDFSD